NVIEDPSKTDMEASMDKADEISKDTQPGEKASMQSTAGQICTLIDGYGIEKAREWLSLEKLNTAILKFSTISYYVEEADVDDDGNKIIHINVKILQKKPQKAQYVFGNNELNVTFAVKDDESSNSRLLHFKTWSNGGDRLAESNVNNGFSFIEFEISSMLSINGKKTVILRTNQDEAKLIARAKTGWVYAEIRAGGGDKNHYIAIMEKPNGDSEALLFSDSRKRKYSLTEIVGELCGSQDTGSNEP
ncbi:MAG: hypothetical protein MUC50_07640, partial [Myxococcota bacterium]|nr:hypothetical protein [Myxococcota bacterium]